jgi:hypothetical protein
MIVLVWLHGGNDLLVYGNIEHRVRLFHDRVGANFQHNVRNLPDGMPNAFHIVDSRKFILTLALGSSSIAVSLSLPRRLAWSLRFLRRRYFSRGKSGCLSCRRWPESLYSNHTSVGSLKFGSRNEHNTCVGLPAYLRLRRTCNRDRVHLRHRRCVARLPRRYALRRGERRLQPSARQRPRAAVSPAVPCRRRPYFQLRRDRRIPSGASRGRQVVPSPLRPLPARISGFLHPLLP